MNSLELGVGKTNLDQQRERRFGMQEILQIAKGDAYFVGRWWDESGLGQSATVGTYPILAGPQLTGL